MDAEINRKECLTKYRFINALHIILAAFKLRFLIETYCKAFVSS